MSQLKSLLHDKDRIIKVVVYLASLFFVVIMGLVFLIYRLPNTWVVHIPPDQRTASQQALGHVPPSTIYSFAYQTFQQLNRWYDNGEVDYEANITKLKPLLTPKCETFLRQDYKDRLRHNELVGRKRGVYEIIGRGYSQDKVTIYSADSWGVTLDLKIDEYVDDEPVKYSTVRFPISIVRMDMDAQKNPWGLGFNCYTSQPLLLEGIEDGAKKNTEGNK